MCTVVRVEGLINSIAEPRKKGTHGDYVLSDITRLELRGKSADALVLLKMLGHLTKEASRLLISRLVKASREKTVFTVPNWLIPQKRAYFFSRKAHGLLCTKNSGDE
jgi:hypothetical protein